MSDSVAEQAITRRFVGELLASGRFRFWIERGSLGRTDETVVTGGRFEGSRLILEGPEGEFSLEVVFVSVARAGEISAVLADDDPQRVAQLWPDEQGPASLASRHYAIYVHELQEALAMERTAAWVNGRPPVATVDADGRLVLDFGGFEIKISRDHLAALPLGITGW